MQLIEVKRNDILGANIAKVLPTSACMLLTREGSVYVNYKSRRSLAMLSKYEISTPIYNHCHSFHWTLRKPHVLFHFHSLSPFISHKKHKDPVF